MALNVSASTARCPAAIGGIPENICSLRIGDKLSRFCARLFVTSDETGARIEGVNAFHWVFCCNRSTRTARSKFALT
jgi:hypothetical protein